MVKSKIFDSKSNAFPLPLYYHYYFWKKEGCTVTDIAWECFKDNGQPWVYHCWHSHRPQAYDIMRGYFRKDRYPKPALVIFPSYSVRNSPGSNNTMVNSIVIGEKEVVIWKPRKEEEMLINPSLFILFAIVTSNKGRNLSWMSPYQWISIGSCVQGNGNH